MKVASMAIPNNLEARENTSLFQPLFQMFCGFTPLDLGHKKRQATYIAPLRPHTLAAFPPWGILQELVV
ncbi:Hypothetical protein I595_543 [Croceitalea dokdonensis DOKDO 023]|uniref:Uncharacterized protein n=1 Tax=Croceitalea dokdonensis DOKDO 023 TaxID=1300341 RepID=A0A0P7B2I4_9FLAO|nr:Hypothetical protein I595_543 [Croceitalea dokdonensis DOKDO 023]